MTKKYKLKVDYITPGGENVLKAGTEFTETAPGSDVYESRSRFMFRGRAVENTDFFEKVEQVSDHRFYSAYLPGYKHETISVSLSQEAYEGLPRSIIVNGMEYLHPSITKLQQERAFEMSRNTLTRDGVNKWFRFESFKEYWEDYQLLLHNNSILW